MKVCHITSAHSRYDTRIFLKMCRSLADAGHSVTLVVSDGEGDEVKHGVRILAVSRNRGRLGRMVKSSRDVYRKALALDVDIYHVHDPELLPYAWLLSLRGYKVIFDAHEDFPKQLQSKYYLNKWVRKGLSKFFVWFESFICKRLSGVVSATPAIAEKFKKINQNSENINNYPMLGELSSNEIDWSKKQPWVAYIGGIAATRGIEQVVKAMELAPIGVQLKLGGRFNRVATKAECESMSAWAKVDELGFICRDAVKEVLDGSIAGLVTFHSHPNHVDAQPNKMFEYMSAGVPVIGSHFDLWREVIEGNHCGICVDPMSPKDIAQAICYLFHNPDEAEKMGRNGQQAVQEKYNWRQEEKKLVEFYRNL